jgi:phage FluMu gp28-like protein
MPRDRDRFARLHPTKRRVLRSGKVSVDGERDARGHADELWALALARQAERQRVRPRGGEIGARLPG